MRLLLLNSFILLICLSSCTEQEKSKKTIAQNEDAFLINLQHYNNDSENYMSFPLWFDAKMIKKHHIRKITRQTFHVSGNTSEEGEANQYDIREIKIYFFNSEGQITHLKASYFYDDRSICDVDFSYTEKLDKWGFAANIKKEIKAKDEIGFHESELPFHLFKLIKAEKKFSTYYSQKDKQLHHYMTNPDFFGPLSVDSILNPKPKDLIYLGSPLNPTKRYQVTNKVHETNVKTFTYKDGQFVSSKRNEFPFMTKRSVIKDSTGTVSKLVDSLFSQNNFLTRTLFVFKTNPKGLPLEIKKLKENSSIELTPISLEKIEYQYDQNP